MMLSDIVLPVVEESKSYVNGLDTLWVLLGAILVFWMQPGFALVEAGLTQQKNTANILMKNFVDFMCGSVLYWVLGFSIMYGAGNAFFGWDGFGFIGSDSNVPAECTFIFQTVFCATTATIVSGAMAERTKFSMYVIYSILISAFVYPFEGHWSWGGGWLADLGFHDFAGSTVVHLCGGALALAGAIVLGPRVGKYDKSEYWESVVQQADKLETITASIKENITGMTLDNLRSEFKTTLMDMDSDVEDFADNLTQKMTDAFLDIQLGKEGGLYDELEKWYDQYYDKLKDEELTTGEIEDAQKHYQDIVQKGINLRDQIAKLTGYDSASASQKATANGIKSITADQADQLVGRITAMQIAVEANRTTNSDMAENVTLGVNYLMRINESVSLSNETLDAILLQNVRSNSYLEDIVRYNKAMYEGWNEEIIKIRRTIEERT